MNWKTGVIFALLAVIVWQILVFSPTETDVPKEPGSVSVTPAKKSNDQWMQGVDLVEVQNEMRDWELHAERARAVKKGARWFLKDVEVLFYTNNELSMTVTGESGMIELKTKNMEIEGNVVSRSSNGYVFRTPSLEYKASGRLLETDQNVRMKGPQVNGRTQLTLRGRGMRAKLNTGIIDVLHDVESTMYTKGKPFKVVSRTAQFSTKKKMANFYGNVVIDVETLRVTGPQAIFKYASGQGDLDSVHVEGGVRVSDLKKWATSKTVDIDFDTEKFVFRGNPRLVQNNDEMVGDVITFYKGGKQVRVERARAKVKKSEFEAETN